MAYYLMKWFHKNSVTEYTIVQKKAMTVSQKFFIKLRLLYCVFYANSILIQQIPVTFLFGGALLHDGLPTFFNFIVGRYSICYLI